MWHFGLEARRFRLLRRGRAAELDDQRDAARSKFAHLGRRKRRLVLVVLVRELDLFSEDAARRVDLLERELEALFFDPGEFGRIPSVVGDDADLYGILGTHRPTEDKQADHARKDRE